MAKYAFFVEDDPDQAEFTTKILLDFGFVVSIFANFNDAIQAIDTTRRPVDLVILDRRLPRAAEDEPSDEVGDELLKELLTLLPDSPFVVFTGHTGVPHHQFATQERGVIDLGPGLQPLDRVCAFEKWQTIDFEKYVKRVAERIDALSDIEVIVRPPSVHISSISRRLLRKVAAHFDGVSISVVSLSGGLTELPVWQCTVLNGAGHEVASVVVKQSDGRKVPPGSGLHTVLPASYVAAPVATVSGLCDGYRAQVMQLAGANPDSLLGLLHEDEAEAARQLRLIAGAMDGVSSNVRGTKTVAELAEPLVDWPTLTERLTGLGIPIPRNGLVASTQTSAQHGDLHPGNVLVVEGHPVLIDFDNEVMASRALDPVTALLSPLFHRDSPIRNSEWPTPEQCSQLGSSEFLEGSPCPSWMSTAQEWFDEAIASERERETLILAFAVRQLKYPDVFGDEKVNARAVALVRTFAGRLNQG